MTTRSARDLPAGLEGPHRRLERWRRTGRGHARIPEVPWAAAVQAADRYGLNPTARALRLDYYSLKNRVEAAGVCRVAGEKVAAPSISDRLAVPAHGQAMAPFVELAPSAAGSAGECILELEEPGGAKRRVHLKGSATVDLTSLSQSFWGAQAGHRGTRRGRT